MLLGPEATVCCGRLKVNPNATVRLESEAADNAPTVSRIVLQPPVPGVNYMHMVLLHNSSSTEICLTGMRVVH